MAGLLDMFGNLSPEQNQGLLAAAAQILQNSGPSRQPFTIGQAMGTGLQAYQGVTEAQRKERESQERQSMQDQQAQAQRAQAEQMRDLQMAGMRQSQEFAAEEAARARLPAAPKPVSYSMNPEWMVDKDGKTKAIVMGNDGNPKVLDGFRPYEPPKAARGAGGSGAAAGMPGKAPAGYRWTQTGELEPIPGGPASVNVSTPQQKIADAKDVISLIDQAKPLVSKATGSYGGLAIDQAARLIGKSTPGADAAAQLSALEGVLISKMPKMSGPQSDKDVAMYRQMAGKIGDPTVPESQKVAAMETIKEIAVRNAGGNQPVTPQARPANVPLKGQVKNGYRFKGGNPADPNAWEKI